MSKEGLQTHIHLIVSRKDSSNSYSLSPESKIPNCTVCYTVPHFLEDNLLLKNR